MSGITSCTSCLLPLENAGYTLPCGHKYHKICFQKYVDTTLNQTKSVEGLVKCHCCDFKIVEQHTGLKMKPWMDVAVFVNFYAICVFHVGLLIYPTYCMSEMSPLSILSGIILSAISHVVLNENPSFRYRMLEIMAVPLTRLFNTFHGLEGSYVDYAKTQLKSDPRAFLDAFLKAIDQAKIYKIAGRPASWSAFIDSTVNNIRKNRPDLYAKLEKNLGIFLSEKPDDEQKQFAISITQALLELNIIVKFS